MTKHTPGPWEIIRFQDPCFEGDDREYAAIDGQTVRVARIIGAVKVHPPAPHEENEANALLIAAAPDMLVALKTIALHAPSLDIVGIRELCDEAIAKAQGAPMVERTTLGPAFTNTRSHPHDHPGMSLRDWFAGQIAASLVANGDFVAAVDARAMFLGEKNANVVATTAYDLADAMLRAREVGHG